MGNHDRALLARLRHFWAALPSTNIAIGLLVIGVCLFVYMAHKGLHSIESIEHHNDASRHALQNSILISETVSLIKDIETGQRGFVITGDESYLAPYLAARDRFDQMYQQLIANLKRTEHQQTYSHEKLDSLVNQRIQQAAFLIDERKARGPAVLEDQSLYHDGKRIMDEIRVEVARLHEVQQGLSETRLELARDIQNRSLRLSYWVSIGGTLLMVVSAFFLIREKRIRDAVQRRLHDANVNLETRIEERTAQLQTALDRIQTFALEQDQNIEGERRRLAREVHDQIGQVFTSIKMLLFSMKTSSAEDKAEQLEELGRLLDDGVVVARRISGELRPALLDDLGLGAAVAHYTTELGRRSSPEITVEIAQDDVLSPMQANQLFRITQEAVTNVQRHAHASRIHIEGSVEGPDYRFTVTDNGVGPQPIRADASGVRNMRERAALAGGTFRFGAAPGKGTRIVVILPLAEGGEECAV